MKKKAMLSQPMNGLTDEEIDAVRERAVKELEARGYEVVNTLFEGEWYTDESMRSRGIVQIPVYFMAKSLEAMAECHAVYFCRGWERTRGCIVEETVARAYGLECIYE